MYLSLSFHCRYDVVAVMSSGRTSFTSDAFPLVVQRAVKLNRLMHQASVLQNQMATVSCRVNMGTNVSFLWSFGDGSSRLGQSTEQHIFHRWSSLSVLMFSRYIQFSSQLYYRLKVQIKDKTFHKINNIQTGIGSV